MSKQEALARWSEPTTVDGEGFVRLIDYMGDDQAIPQAARVSYGAGTKTVREDAQLIRFLMRNEHFSPFAMCQVKLHLRLPIFVHNQFVRHDRFHWNVMSARYSEMPKEAWTPTVDEVRGQGQGNKQVGDGEVYWELRDAAVTNINRAYYTARTEYERMLKHGVCREQARTVLPMGQYTEAYVTANLGDWLLFLRARLSPHAQLEIRVFAEAIYEIFKDLFPVTMEAFADYQLGGTRLSAQEMETLKDMLNGQLGVMCKITLDGNEVSNSRVETSTAYQGEMGTPHDQETTCRQAVLADIGKEARKALLGKHIPTTRERAEFWKKIT